MTSRIDIAAVEATATITEVLGVFAAQAHSRMPVFRESLDEPIGFIHIKDVVADGVRAGWSAEFLSSRRVKALVAFMKTLTDARYEHLLK